jgi:hypothetical protein
MMASIDFLHASKRVVVADDTLSHASPPPLGVRGDKY